MIPIIKLKTSRTIWIIPTVSCVIHRFTFSIKSVFIQFWTKSLASSTMLANIFPTVESEECILLNSWINRFIWLGTVKIMSRILPYNSGIIILRSVVINANIKMTDTKIPTPLDICFFFFNLGQCFSKSGIIRRSIHFTIGFSKYAIASP